MSVLFFLLSKGISGEQLALPKNANRTIKRINKFLSPETILYQRISIKSKYLSNDLNIKQTRYSKFRLFQEKSYQTLFDPTLQDLIRQNP